LSKSSVTLFPHWVGGSRAKLLGEFPAHATMPFKTLLLAFERRFICTSAQEEAS
jgi:hypothetical protein